MTLHEKLIDIQQHLEVPKLRENSFGGFNYRSIEDIEEKVKPFLVKHNLTLKFDDDMVAVGDRVYVKTTAVLSDGETQATSTGFAREAEKPKAKTDDAQLTGGTSSYARKYAAQGLFLIDDGKGDPDNPTPPKEALISASLSDAKRKVFEAFKKAGVDDTTKMMEIIQQAIGKDSIENADEASKVMEQIEKQ